MDDKQITVSNDLLLQLTYTFDQTILFFVVHESLYSISSNVYLLTSTPSIIISCLFTIRFPFFLLCLYFRHIPPPRSFGKLVEYCPLDVMFFIPFRPIIILFTLFSHLYIPTGFYYFILQTFTF